MRYISLLGPLETPPPAAIPKETPLSLFIPRQKSNLKTDRTAGADIVKDGLLESLGNGAVVRENAEDVLVEDGHDGTVGQVEA